MVEQLKNLQIQAQIQKFIKWKVSISFSASPDHTDAHIFKTQFVIVTNDI
jgi:hypothetical protein